MVRPFKRYKVEQKALLTQHSGVHRLNDELDEGWRVKSVTAQHVSTGSTLSIQGIFLVILERESPIE
jgi:hypothetical protein